MNAFTSSGTPTSYSYKDDLFIYFSSIHEAPAQAVEAEQCRAYLWFVGRPGSTEKNYNVNCRFGILAKTSGGITETSFPSNKYSFKVIMNIDLENVPLLLSLADMDRLGNFYKRRRQMILWRNWRFNDIDAFSLVFISSLRSSATILSHGIQAS